MKEIQKIVRYPPLVMFMLMHHNLVDQLQVAQTMNKLYHWDWCLLLVHCALAKFRGYLWVYLEGKRLEKLLDKGATINNLAEFLTDHPNWYTRYEATSFFICQVLALMTSIVQIILMNHYLGNSSFVDLFPMEQLGVRNS